MECLEWRRGGFALPPLERVVGVSGLTVFRCWGGTSTELGSGYFSLQRPSTVSEAELRFNIVDWGNAIRHVSTFLMMPGTTYWIGPIQHGSQDMRLPAWQVYMRPPLAEKVKLLGSRLPLVQDVAVQLVAGRA